MLPVGNIDLSEFFSTPFSSAFAEIGGFFDPSPLRRARLFSRTWVHFQPHPFWTVFPIYHVGGALRPSEKIFPHLADAGGCP